jgi:CubicO group peptidase (beta-lactamase class C family)
VVCLVARKGKIVFYKARGVKDMALELPLNRSDIFRIMSMTKAITSVAIMMLYEEGKLMLDDPVSKYIPSFAEPRILRRIQLGRDTTYIASPAKQEPQIRHLLSHTSGIGYSNALYKKHKIPDFYTYDSLTLAQTIPVLGSLPLLHEPGERFSYGLNTDVLGHIVEVISGMSLAEFFEKRIFRPLGMEDTHFYLPPRKAERLVMLYQSPNPGELRAVRNSITADFPLRGAKTYYSGGAGLCSTALDYARFLQMLLNGGRFNGTQLLSRKSIEMMGRNQIGELHVWDGVNKFGLGFRITTEAGSAVFPWSEGSLSWGGLYRTDYWIDPKEELQVVVMTQVWPSKAPYLHDQLKPVIYQSIID